MSASTMRQVFVESGYRCAVPTCRTVVFLEIHHLERVADGGGNGADNLLALCPTCHDLHHRGIISREALQVYKRFLQSLTEAFDQRTVDVLLMLASNGPILCSGDGLLGLAGPIASGYIAFKSVNVLVYRAGLTPKGMEFVMKWTEAAKRPEDQEA